MTSKERIARMYAHKEADRIPILDTPWAGTVRRWQKEGMPVGMDWREYFDVDKNAGFSVDISPRFPEQVLEETERYRIIKSAWGVTMKQLKEEDSTPEFIDYEVNTPEKWEKAKKRMLPQRDRINWKYLEEEYPKWQTEGLWTTLNFWFGFDVTHSWMAGTETILVAMLEEPDWVRDMFDTYLDQCIQLFEMVLQAGYCFDEIRWPDDMGYKGTPFFSNALYRELLMPVQKRAVDWAHRHGMKARLHSCGDIMPLLPDLLSTGIDALNPLEVKAGMDSIQIKQQYGERLVLHGGINAVLWDDPPAILAEIERLVPILKENGGYIFGSDHSIPNCVSLETMQQIVNAAKQYGSYV